MKTIDDLDVRGRRVLPRADLNVPLDDARITDDGKIRACLPTLNALLDRGAAVLVCSHLYVGDGFGTAHRLHASVCDVPARLPHAAGYLIRAETAALQRRRLENLG